MAKVAHVRRLPAATRIFSQGDENVRAHAVIEGAVRILQSGSEGGQVVMRFVGPGQIFGAVAIFTDGRYPADAETLTETVEASWTETELNDAIAACPTLGVNLIRIVGRRLQEVQHRVRELATQSAEQRVARAVLRLAQQAGRKTDGGTTIAFPLRRKDVADISGTTLHTASRILAAWEKQGIVFNQHRRLTIQHLSRLRGMAEDSR
ncbi:MAG: Crp/Fnr family transcriptional regulator [Rhizomicrobium sp.]